MQPRVVACVERLIDAEVQRGRFVPPVPPEVLAYAIVRLGEAFLYNDAIAGIRGDTERLRQVEAALLGLRARTQSERVCDFDRYMTKIPGNGGDTDRAAPHDLRR